jgi:Fe-S-cluster containining protein
VAQLRKGTIVSLPSLRTKIRREDLPAGECLCDYCSAKCCKYFALPIEMPTEARDWEFIRWYLMHEAATIFKEDDTWYLLVHTKCKHLQSDNRCGAYYTRPTICREYSTENCEYEDEWLYEQYLETSEQVVEYAEAVLPRKRGKSIRSAKPPALPVLVG